MKTEAKYDRLAGFFGKRRRVYPVHKKLNLPKEQNYTGHSSVNDWLIHHIRFEPGEQILDAGCGVGNTLIQLALRYPIQGTGITLSAVEKERADHFARQNGLEQSIYFRHQSYDEPLPGKFDSIIAIESLKHTQDLSASMANLAAHLKPGGRIIIVEDLWTIKPGENHGNKILHESMSFFHDFTWDDYQEALENSGLKLENSSDLSGYIRHRKAWQFRLLKTWNALLRRLFFTGPLHQMFSVFYAGFLFEEHYRNKKLQYWVLEASANAPGKRPGRRNT